MPIFDKCCCCYLKTGCIVLGSLCLLGAIIGLGNSCNDMKTLIQADQGIQEELSKFEVKYGKERAKEKLNEVLKKEFANDETLKDLDYDGFANLYNAGMTASAFKLVISILYIPGSICLIIGANKVNATLVSVFLVVDGINIVLIFLQMIIYFAVFGFNIIILITCIIAASFAVLIWLFPFSLRQDIRAGGDGTAKPDGTSCT